MTTLVETVSINYEDFNESFLTCSTCLCMYDGIEHTPKLLSCSHTVCYSCLERITSNIGVVNAGSFRCPICRETIPLPRGGVRALPPSFLVNQLLDLMASHRREVIPKCSIHPSQELLFCETCDCVFCIICTDGVHGSSGASCEHTVIPFSIAVKRLSEIFLYKAHLCTQKLTTAADSVSAIMEKLDNNIDTALEIMNASFEELQKLVGKRKKEVLDVLTEIYERKKQVLTTQLGSIKEEMDKVDQECNGLQFHVDIKDITKRISSLCDKYESITDLMEPKENSFLVYDYTNSSAQEDFENALRVFGNIKTSRTFPALCLATVKNTPAYLEAVANVKTVDYYGNCQNEGGDLITSALTNSSGINVPVKIEDKCNGIYELKYVPPEPGQYNLHISIFDRPIRSSPFRLYASEHIDPVCCFGTKGSGENNVLQPVAIAVQNNNIFVLDTGNNRIVSLNSAMEFQHHIAAKGLDKCGGTGLAITLKGTIIIINWRSRMVTELSLDGKTIHQFTHNVFVEPTDIAVNSRGEILVADDCVKSVFVFDQAGNLLQKIGEKGNRDGQLNLITSVAIGPHDDVIIAGGKIQIFNNEGRYLREISLNSKISGQYGGIFCDAKENLLASRTEKTMSFIQIIDYNTGRLKFVIDSYSAKLKRPTGVAAEDGNAFVVDLGNNCIKKYRYE